MQGFFIHPIKIINPIKSHVAFVRWLTLALILKIPQAYPQTVNATDLTKTLFYSHFNVLFAKGVRINTAHKYCP